MLLDLVNQVTTFRAISPRILTASTQGSSKDFTNCEFSTGMIVDVGSITTANVTSLVVQCEESADGSTNWTAISGMVCTVTATTTEANLHQVVRGLRTQPYVRANAITLSATTTTGAFPMAVEIIAQNKFVNQGGGSDQYPSS